MKVGDLVKYAPLISAHKGIGIILKKKKDYSEIHAPDSILFYVHWPSKSVRMGQTSWERDFRIQEL
jgi:hypothetical protein|tara:strand:- start:540 stop:737 length:198 start_codon:yes stop_codon:yes gene_type:complete